VKNVEGATFVIPAKAGIQGLGDWAKDGRGDLGTGRLGHEGLKRGTGERAFVIAKDRELVILNEVKNLLRFFDHA